MKPWICTAASLVLACSSTTSGGGDVATAAVAGAGGGGDAGAATGGGSADVAGHAGIAGEGGAGAAGSAGSMSAGGSAAGTGGTGTGGASGECFPATLDDLAGLADCKSAPEVVACKLLAQNLCDQPDHVCFFRIDGMCGGAGTLIWEIECACGADLNSCMLVAQSLSGCM